MKVLVASQNRKKLSELQRILRLAKVDNIELLSLSDVGQYQPTAETGASFADNAHSKAADGVYHSGLPTIADDSGICVDALNGMPGVLSARWAGRHGDDQANNELLLMQMSDVPEGRRGACFVCACALHLPKQLAQRIGMRCEYVVEGLWHGTVLSKPCGYDGFGYDPLFCPKETPGMSAAQLSPMRKDELSHRGKAMAGLVELLRELGNRCDR